MVFGLDTRICWGFLRIKFTHRHPLRGSWSPTHRDRAAMNGAPNLWRIQTWATRRMYSSGSIIDDMTDTLTKKGRSERMSLIRGTDTGPELVVCRIVHSMGFRYRLHVKTLPGKPDLVFPRLRKVILVHGCFWHRIGKDMYVGETAKESRRVLAIQTGGQPFERSDDQEVPPQSGLVNS